MLALRVWSALLARRGRMATQVLKVILDLPGRSVPQASPARTVMTAHKVPPVPLVLPAR